MDCEYSPYYYSIKFKRDEATKVAWRKHMISSAKLPFDGTYRQIGIDYITWLWYNQLDKQAA